ncbi:11300_t:CDS:10 [Entrophospora sp. SA101]|nr:11300_t:CDS:10 [Entrophospora sp. SA101]
MTSKAPIKLSEYPLRPNFGSSGRLIQIRANFFEVISFPDFNVYQYDVNISPEVPPGLNRRVFKHLESLGTLGGVKPVYDGRNNAFTIKDLPFGDALTIGITLPDDNQVQTSRRPPRNFTIKMRKVAEKNLEEAIRFVNGKSALSNNVLTAITALDVLINQVPSNQFKAIGRRAFYSPENSQPLDGGAEVWSGYWQSLRPGQGRFYINFDTSATAFYEAGNLAEIIAKILGARRVEDLRRGINERDRNKLERTLKSLKFHVTHKANFKRRYKIKKLSDRPAQYITFERENQDQINVVEYFHAKYNLRLQYPFLPCVTTQNGSYFPPEVCYVEPGQRITRKLTSKQTADMIKFTCQPPSSRQEKIQRGFESLNYDQNDYCKQWGLRTSKQMAMIEARVLPSPKVAYHPSSREASFTPQLGKWQLGPGKKMLQGATLESWSVVVFSNPQHVKIEVVQNFIRELTKTLSENDPPIFHENSQRSTEEAIRRAYQAAGKATNIKPQLIICVLQTRSNLYDEIKRVEGTILGVPTQVDKYISVTINKQYCGMLGLKINVKLQGSNMSLQNGFLPFFQDEPTIVFGADVTHPKFGEETTPSIAAVVGSFDPKGTKYATSIRFQAPRTEIISSLQEMVQELLKVFYKETKRKPQRILFYRDGVSEGQFEAVKTTEVEQIRKACTQLEATYKPAITFIVVQKRHHARFFPTDSKNVDRSRNCLPGTVVDKSITHPFEYDFYLLSHPGLQGTSRPTHYHVLVDDNKFKPDVLQTLTYNFCYLYARCPQAVSMVPPAYYAHLAAFRARFWKKKPTQFEDDSADSEQSTNVEDYGLMKPELQKIMFYI